MVRARANAYDKANPDKQKARNKAAYARGRDELQAKKAMDRKANPDVFKARYKRWATKNHEQVLANVRRLRRPSGRKTLRGHTLALKSRLCSSGSVENAPIVACFSNPAIMPITSFR